jgi:hypothetical protein
MVYGSLSPNAVQAKSKYVHSWMIHDSYCQFQNYSLILEAYGISLQDEKTQANFVAM